MIPNEEITYGLIKYYSTQLSLVVWSQNVDENFLATLLEPLLNPREVDCGPTGSRVRDELLIHKDMSCARVSDGGGGVTFNF